MGSTTVPDRVRVSLGSAVVLGLIQGKIDVMPTTIYLMTYHPGKCNANCAFCPQARTSRGKADMLSRVTWPPFPTKKVVSGVRLASSSGLVKRLCIQAVNYGGVFEDIVGLVTEFKECTDTPISVCCQPLDATRIGELAKAGVDRVCFAVDAATKELFDRVKGRGVGGPYVLDGHFDALEAAVRVFGRGRVTTHIIVGLGERDEELVHLIQQLVDMGVYPGLFAFTPVTGTMLDDKPQPPLRRYRRIQIAHYIITQGKARYESMRFGDDGEILDFGVSRGELRRIVETGEPFMTSGCPGCNRPFYNERPGGPIYNYPRRLHREDILTVEREVGLRGGV